MNMSPDTYKQIKQGYRDISNHVRLYLEGQAVDGSIIPMTLLEDIEKLQERIAKEIGICEYGKKSLKPSARIDEYQKMIDQLECYLTALRDLKRQII